ncbi:MAG: hypothetical protein Q8O72_09950, partial [Bacteroidales bacterium]|nr:hypothetical protein [Bacteroidales bacterium]
RITPHLVDRLQLNELKVAFFLLGKSRKIKIKIMNEYIGFRHSIFRGFRGIFLFGVHSILVLKLTPACHIYLACNSKNFSTILFHSSRFLELWNR